MHFAKPLYVLLFLILVTQVHCSWVDDLLNKSKSDHDIQTYGASVCEDREVDRGETINSEVTEEELDLILTEFRSLVGDSTTVKFGSVSKDKVQSEEVRALLSDLAAEAVAQSNTIGAKDEVLARRLDTDYYEDLHLSLFSNMARSEAPHTCYFLNYLYQYSYRKNLKSQDREFKTQIALTSYNASTGEKVLCEIVDKAIEKLQRFVFCNDDRETPSTGGGSWDDDD